MSLTDTAIRTVKLAEKPFKMYDRDGLFLLVKPGGSKLWRWRHFDGKEKLMALGEYPLLTVFLLPIPESIHPGLSRRAN